MTSGLRCHRILLHTLAAAILATTAILAGSCETHHDPAKRSETPLPAYGLRERPAARAYLNLPSNDRTPAPPLLSQTGAFKDVRTLTPADDLIPYDLNVAFWSDGAAKARWIVLPHRDATHSAKIRFSPSGEWSFPNGTVFVKHFEMPTDAEHPTKRRRLETRLLVRDDTGGIYGVTYKWRPDNSDADRVDQPQLEPIEIKTADGVRKQNYYLPAPADCRVCHTPQAGLVLGVKTRQLNRPFAYPGATDNQLRTWNHLGMFEPAISENDIAGYAKLARADDPHASLEERARSFIDANCSQCHRPGGAPGFFDARFDTPLQKQNLIKGPMLINLGVDHARLIAPNDVWRSVLLARLTTLEQPKMPPLAHETIDRGGVELIESWIRSLPGPKVLPPPTLSPVGGEFAKPIQVELKHPEPGVTIRYTLDGSVPTSSGAVYEKPIQIAGPTTLRAKAFKSGMTNSITVQETYIVGEP